MIEYKLESKNSPAIDKFQIFEDWLAANRVRLPKLELRVCIRFLVFSFLCAYDNLRSASTYEGTADILTQSPTFSLALSFLD